MVDFKKKLEKVKTERKAAEELQKGLSNIRLSATRFKTFEDCPKQWYLSNVVHPCVDTGNQKTKIGTAIHAAIETSAMLRRCADNVPDLADRTEVMENLEDWLIQNKGYLEPASKIDALEVIDGFHSVNLGDQAADPETEWEMYLEDLDQVVKGTWDLIKIFEEGHDLVVEVVDWKTGAWVPTQEEFETDKQVGLYLTAAKERFPKADRVVAKFVYLREGVVLQTSWTPELDRRHRAATVGTARLMLKGYNKANVDDHCKICHWRMECDEFKASVEDATIDEIAVPTDAHNSKIIEERFRLKQRIKALERYVDVIDAEIKERMKQKETTRFTIGGYTATMASRSQKSVDSGKLEQMARELGLNLGVVLEKACSVSLIKLRRLIETEEQRETLDDYQRSIPGKPYLLTKIHKPKKRKAKKDGKKKN